MSFTIHVDTFSQKYVNELKFLTMATTSSSSPQEQQQHPLAYSIVWSPLPPITCILPFIGHMGITTSQGIACDFQGPYSVGDRGRMAFGHPTRALQIIDIRTLGGEDAAEKWDASIRIANDEYRTRMHNICCDNCHSHVAYALNAMEIQAGQPFGIRNWDMVKLCFLVFFKGRFLSWNGVLVQFAPFALLTLFGILARRTLM